MKFMNKYIFASLFVSAAVLTGCEYEDTETLSEEASAEAVGAHFAEDAEFGDSTVVVVRPGTGKFDIALCRANANGAATVPVVLLKQDKDENGQAFCTVPTAFNFADKALEAPFTVNYTEHCAFLKPYTMQLQVNEGKKDHPYAAGYTTFLYTLIQDYTWKAYATVFSETPAGQDKLSDEPVQLSIQRAANYYTKEDSAAVEKDNLKDFFYIPSVYGGEDGFRFLLDSKTHTSAEVVNSSNILCRDAVGIPMETKLATGKEKDGKTVYLEVTSVTVVPEGSDVIEDGMKISVRKVTVTSDLYAGEDAVTPYAVNKTVFEMTFTEKVPDQITEQ